MEWNAMFPLKTWSFFFLQASLSLHLHLNSLALWEHVHDCAPSIRVTLNQAPPCSFHTYVSILHTPTSLNKITPYWLFANATQLWSLLFQMERVVVSGTKKKKTSSRDVSRVGDMFSNRNKFSPIQEILKYTLAIEYSRMLGERLLKEEDC